MRVTEIKINYLSAKQEVDYIILLLPEVRLNKNLTRIHFLFEISEISWSHYLMDNSYYCYRYGLDDCRRINIILN